MNKCVKIRVEKIAHDAKALDLIIKNARTLHIEGSVQYVESEGVRIVACGGRDAVESFVDFVHRTFTDPSADIFVEPFLKDRDYRGVFRIIE